MDLGLDRFFPRLKEHYDKVLAFGVLLVLVSSLALLGVRIGMMRQIRISFETEMRGLRPARERLAEVDAVPYGEARRSLAQPMQLTDWGVEGRDGGWLFVSETRFRCRECRLPVNILAEVCPFCQTAVVPPAPEKVDHDEDGMPTWWEQKYGLDPNDPADANKDLDGDGFTNIEEFKAGTDPTDPDSHPPYVSRLTVAKDGIGGSRFALKFMSRVRTPSGFKFGLNYALPNGQTRTEFVEIGQTVEGFKVESHEGKQGATHPSRPVEDLSELVLLTPRGDRVVLVRDRPTQYVELTARLKLELAGIREHWDVRKGDDFPIDDRVYRVIDIDAEGPRVVLLDKLTSVETVIGAPRPGTEGEPDP